MADNRVLAANRKLAIQVRQLMASGMTRVQARAAIGLPRDPPSNHHHKGTLVVVEPRRRGPGRPRNRESIVPTRYGDDVTTRGGGHLTASISGHVEVKFDQAQVGGVLTGLFLQLRTGGATPLQAIFPDRYPLLAAAAIQSRDLAQERQIGAEAGKLLGAGLRAYGITPQEWAAWYALAISQTGWIDSSAGGVVAVASPNQGVQSNFGSIVGAPQQQISSRFGEPR